MSLRSSRFWSVVFLSVLAGASAAGFLVWRGVLFPRYDSIKDLKEVAVHAPVRLLGVVTYADGPGKRFWLQDQTEAIAVPADPAAAGC